MDFNDVVIVLTPDCMSMSVCVRMMLNTAWDLLLSSFIFVAATVRDLFPSDIRDSMSCESYVTNKNRGLVPDKITCLPCQ